MSNSLLYKGNGLVSGYGADPVLHDLNIELYQGEILGVLGPNGSGKSTLIRTLTGALPLSSGEIYLDDRKVSDFNRQEQAQRVAVVPQASPVLFSFSVRETVEMGRYPHAGSLSAMRAKDNEVVTAAMREVDIYHLQDRAIDQLSGGEWQRVMLARALAQRSKVLLLDEPTAHLDLSHQLQVFKIVEKLCREEGTGVLCVLQDLNLAAEFCGRLMLMTEGRILFEGKPEEVITIENLRKVYGVEVEIERNPYSNRPMVIFRSRNERGGTQ